MSYLYRLAGENLELAEAELEGFLRSQKIQENPVRSGRLAETNDEPSQLKRLALTHEVSRKICETDRNLETDYIPESSFAVRAENLTEEDLDTREIEKDLGAHLSVEGNSVDLENPDTVVKAYVMQRKLVLGEVVEDINRGLFDGRKNQNRPFSSPISLDPVLARVLVNLSGVKPGEKLLDPFCGTGGLLIEAGLCGVGVYGADISEEMAEGCEKNLEEYGIISHSIRQGEISNVEEIFDDQNFDAIVTDLPYGKASKKTDSAVEDFLDLIEGFQGQAVFMYDEDELGDYSADFSVYIHKNLTRHIFIQN